MPRRRPVRTNAGAVACVVLLTSGCTAGAVDVARTDPGDDAAACERLVDALPQTLADQERRDVDDAAATTAAAWGDPPIVLRCGVGEPASFDALSSCQITNGVAWYIPDEQITGRAVDITMTTIGREPGVEVRIPADYFPPAATMVDLAAPLKEHTEKVERCG
jgi:uncharacterized protein DUF3515